MIYIPFFDMQESAVSLETHDLRQSIRVARDKILDGPEPFEANVLAKYGLVMCHELRTRTGELPVKQQFWLTHFSGAPEWPRFMLDYCWKHRALLVLLGWTRYLAKNYGFDPEGLAELMDSCPTCGELDSKIKSMLKPDDDGSSRQYSQFKELPGAYSLLPDVSPNRS